MDQTLTFLAKDDTRQLLEELCASKGIDYLTFQELIEAEFKQMGKQRKRGLTLTFDEILGRIFEDDLK